MMVILASRNVQLFLAFKNKVVFRRNAILAILQTQRRWRTTWKLTQHLVLHWKA